MLGLPDGRAVLALISAALAATPVILDDPPGIGLALVSERTGLPTSELVPLDPETVIQPGTTDSIPCIGSPVTMDDLRAQLDAAIHDYDSGDLGAARERAAGLGPALACLLDPVDPDWLWSAGFVSGVLAWADGDRAAARRAWVGARGLDPQRQWDDNFTPGTALDHFATAVPIDIVDFRAVGGPFLVDGRPTPLSVPVGTHVLQAGDPLQTWLVEVRADVVAVHPAADPPSLPLDELLAVLADRQPGVGIVYVVRGDDVDRLDLLHGSVELLSPPEPPPRRRSWGRAVIAGGAASLAVGLTAVLVARPAAAQASEDGWTAYEAGDVTAWEEANDAHTNARTWLYAGYGLAAVGVVSVAVGTTDVVRHSNQRTLTSDAYRLDTRIARSPCQPSGEMVTCELSRRSHTTVPSVGSTSMIRMD